MERPAYSGLMLSDNLAPLLGFLSDELAEVGGRAGKWGSETRKPRLHLGIDKASIHLLVELGMISAGVHFGTPTPYPLFAS